MITPQVNACSRCGDLDRQADMWPDASGGYLCQVCWEAVCAEAWWDFIAPAPAHETSNEVVNDNSQL